MNKEITHYNTLYESVILGLVNVCSVSNQHSHFITSVHIVTSVLHYFVSPEFCDHLSMHGDGVKDIAFEVEDIEAIFKVLVTCSFLKSKILGG